MPAPLPILKKVYDSLNTKFLFEKKEMEVSALFAGGAALIALVAVFLSLPVVQSRALKRHAHFMPRPDAPRFSCATVSP